MHFHQKWESFQEILFRITGNSNFIFNSIINQSLPIFQKVRRYFWNPLQSISFQDYKQKRFSIKWINYALIHLYLNHSLSIKQSKIQSCDHHSINIFGYIFIKYFSEKTKNKWINHVIVYWIKVFFLITNQNLSFISSDKFTQLGLKFKNWETFIFIFLNWRWIQRVNELGFFELTKTNKQFYIWHIWLIMREILIENSKRRR